MIKIKPDVVILVSLSSFFIADIERCNMDSDINNKKYCPLCRKQLILKNEILFCLSCKIYIGKPETFHISFGPNSHYFHQEHEFLYKKEEEETVTHVFLTYIIIFILVVGILFLSLEYFYKPYIEKIQKQEQVKLDKNL